MTHEISIWKMASRTAMALVILASGIIPEMRAQQPDRILRPVSTDPQDRPVYSGGGVPHGWRVADPITYENISVFPVLARTTADTSSFTTLDEGLASGDVVVSESGGEIIRRSRDGHTIPMLGGGARVNQLVLINRGSRPVLLLAGEVVSGGKQDRIIAKDRIIRPGSEPLPLDVFCVEHGRWTGASSEFKVANAMVHPSVRERAAVDKEQTKVWDAVRNGTNSAYSDAAAGGVASAPSAAPRISREAVSQTMAVEAQSESYLKVYKDSRVGQSVEAFAEEVGRRFQRLRAGLKGENIVGVVVAYGGEVAWADTFASTILFDRYWPKLLRSYAVEAMARPRTNERATLNEAREFLEPLGGRENIENEPGVYRRREVNQGRYAEIEITALAPKTLDLHWTKIHRTS
ncbi:MAG: hypothetical protein HY046_06885 [Acidobacteria bacterium]|nr:hypothetical protein [Acidobacteriota bacterium]